VTKIDKPRLSVPYKSEQMLVTPLNPTGDSGSTDPPHAPMPSEQSMTVELLDTRTCILPPSLHLSLSQRRASDNPSGAVVSGGRSPTSAASASLSLKKKLPGEDDGTSQHHDDDDDDDDDEEEEEEELRKA
jgi:hypothetical protein